uniref:A2L zinc ribbon domain protein n=1 Tax=Promethearchaeum syntrophicum TaxID=2594042 RepID=A0A5B9DF14_9ARCH|nr:hypothetical protein [Candidatus Prometheoarchaeum syntrophicum]QEE17724.1 A2L zinc ribbon domain protein [Candidatus Prometheoarchaeum syntrophicum]
MNANVENSRSESKSTCEECKSSDLVLLQGDLICQTCGLIQPLAKKYANTVDFRILIKDYPIQEKKIELFDDDNFSYEEYFWDSNDDVRFDPVTHDLLPDITQVIEYEHRLKHPEIDEELKQEIKKSQCKRNIQITYMKNHKIKIHLTCLVCATKNDFYQHNIYKNDFGIKFHRKCKKCGTQFLFTKNRSTYKIIVVLNKPSV